MNVTQIKRVFSLSNAGDGEAVKAELPRLNAIRTTIQQAGLIPALKSIKAAQTGDARWLNTRAPLLSADPAIGQKIVAEFDM